MSVSELLLLRAAEQTAKRTPEDQRLAVNERLSIGRQRAQAADVLWTNGHTAEGLRMARDAYLATRGALARLHDGDDRLEKVGLREAEREALVKLDADLDEDEALPALDAGITPEHGRRFKALVSGQRSLDAAIGPAAMTPAQVARTRLLRIGGLVLAVVGIALVVGLLVQSPPGATARASATWSETSGLAEHAIDGDPTTEWTLPNRTPGWLEITLSPPERLEVVRILNGHNGGYNDRAVRSAVVEIYDANGQVRRRHSHDWPGVQPRPEWVELEVGVDAVERIRVEVRGFHREGASLAEIDWD